MRLLDRYLLRELLVPLAVCAAAFFVFWLAFNLFTELDDLQDLKLHAGDIAEYYIVRLPELLPTGLPVSLLLALLYTLTNHARYNEITAMRAAGISLWRLSAPYFVTGALASVVLFMFNEFWISDSADKADAIKMRRVATATSPEDHNLEHNLSFINSRDGHEWHIATYNRKTAQMLNPQVIWKLADGSHRWLYAERAVWKDDNWVFLNAIEYREGSLNNAPPVPVLQSNVLAMPDFTETPAQISTEIKMSKRLTLKNARSQDIPLREIVEYLHFHPNPPREINYLLQAKFHERLAAPLSCLVVVIIAIPFGAASGRRNIFAGVAGSVFLCFAYFVLLRLGQAFGATGTIAPWLGAWFPNLAFGTAGTWMTIKAR